MFSCLLILLGYIIYCSVACIFVVEGPLKQLAMRDAGFMGTLFSNTDSNTNTAKPNTSAKKCG